ncbi:cellulase family glycosylhydrolase [Paenibacillus andongensis]|uniref:cellulase family glycosylhydrolase n=1 Tax=Paenibacillus andongensis TaxID=2975482 RepID=UPI0021BB4AF0|nr:cellulase family glycosylhydrolase [Paenibacillus andongensis]
MKRTRYLRRLTAFLVTLSIVITFDFGNLQPASAAESQSPSLAYAQAMGQGWNIFNTFDSFNSNDFSLSDETSWGQPKVTQDLILAAKAKGFKSVRIPMTAYTRYTLGADGHYVIDSAWLARYKQVVDWAVDAGFYVMINLHHDSWIWLKNWDGNTSSEEYKRYVDLWTQLANYFKDEPGTVNFETINEPQFASDTGTITQQDKLNMINKAAFDVIRKSGGKNATRMIIIPSYQTSSDVDKADATYNFIAGLNDPNLIATVHFYSDWVFSGNLGITGFDEQLYKGSPDTPRSHVDLFFNNIYNSFMAKGIGVVIGEYGWLAPDQGAAVNQPGEKLKYLEYFNYKASQYGVSPMIWPPAFDRVAPYGWNSLIGSTINAAIQGQRSSYSTGLNEIYIKQKVTSGIRIPLTLNGNSFVGIAGMKKSDYSYDATTATLTLSKEFVNKNFKEGSYGVIADLDLQFSAGADWHQYIIKYATPVFQTATGTTTEGITIPVSFNGAKVRRASAYDASGNRIGPNSWFPYMQFGGEFTADYNKGTFSILSGFFNNSVSDGTIKLTIEFYDGQVINYAIQKSGTNVTGIGVVP